jgi:hypothetical protein
MVTRTSNLTTTMIVNDWVYHDDNREWASSTPTMVVRTIDSICNDDSKRANCLTVTKLTWTQQSASLITETFTSSRNGINREQGKLAWSQQTINGIDRNDVHESKQLHPSMAMRIAGEKTRSKQQSTSLWLFSCFLQCKDICPRNTKVLSTSGETRQLIWLIFWLLPRHGEKSQND